MKAKVDETVVQPGVVVHGWEPSTQEAEAGGSRSAWSTK